MQQQSGEPIEAGKEPNSTHSHTEKKHRRRRKKKADREKFTDREKDGADRT